jgi:hypothetical protein
MDLHELLSTERHRTRLAGTLALPLIILDDLEHPLETTGLAETLTAVLTVLAQRRQPLGAVADWIALDGEALVARLAVAGVRLRPATRDWLLSRRAARHREGWAAILRDMVVHPDFHERLERMIAQT